MAMSRLSTRLVPPPPRRHCHYALLTFLCKGRPKSINNSPKTGFAMTITAAIETRTAEAKAWSRANRIASVEILHDLSRAETIWRGLEDQQQFSTQFQPLD